MQQLTVIKIGGNIIDDESRLAAFLKDFAAVGGHKILVHGGGKIASAIGRQLGVEPVYAEGRRITDADTLQLVIMVYGGLINKKIVAGLQGCGCNAIGLTGADGNLIKAVKRPVKEIDYGFAGDIETVNSQVLTGLLQAGLTPVLAPLTHDGQGGLLNTNADTIAAEIARAMAPGMHTQLIYCFEKGGVLLDSTDPTSVISMLGADEFGTLKARGIIADGMIPKLENAFNTIAAGVQKVVIGQVEALHQLIHGTSGTQIL